MESICVVGLGYIGLPTAAVFASNGKKVVGIDLNEKVVNTLNQGRIHIEEPGLEEVVAEAVASGNLRASMTPEVCDAYIIAVPTPVLDDHTADMRAVKSAARSLVKYIRPGCLVILESTSPPGTTANLVAPILEESGLKAGTDFMLCYSPERVLPGRILIELRENDRVVGGVTPESADRGKELYSAIVTGEIITTDSVTAEAVKVMENTYRDVNIALANEFALIADKIGFNVWEAIRIANHHPRVKVLSPGPGVGGHCIAVDPWFLVEAAPEQAKLIKLARNINDRMPSHVVELVHSALDAQSPWECEVACFGLTFKANVDDTRESPAMHIVSLLKDAGFKVRCYDPHVLPDALPHLRMVGSVEEALEGAHMLLILVDHAEFKDLTPSVASNMATRFLIDTRNLLDSNPWRVAGFDFHRIGEARPAKQSIAEAAESGMEPALPS